MPNLSASPSWLLAAALSAFAAAPVHARPADSAPAAATVVAAPRISKIQIPGDPRFVAVARDVLLVQAAYTPDFASQSGLVDDALRLPSFAPQHIAALTKRLRADMARLRALPWRQWPVDQQIDLRWVYANAERMDRELNVERLYLHRPGAWLETTANSYLAILTYAPGRSDALSAIAGQIPALVREMSALCRPTQVDAEVAQGLLDGMIAMLKARPVPQGDAAIAALSAYRRELERSHLDQPYAVIGAENYAWRLKHASLLPWDPAALLALAEQKLATADAEMAKLKPQLPPPGPLPPELKQQATALNQAAILALHDQIQLQNLAAIQAAGFVTVPAGVGPVRTRVTPDAMVPLTGDGGSMNPPPPFIDDTVGWWNIGHFNPAMSQEERERNVRGLVLFKETGMGPYAVHEGVPGHHLQLSIARLNPNPLRNLFQDAVQNEGWALYAEQEMWEQGGLGNSLAAQYNVLRSDRFRIRRVVYDVNIETGKWPLQQGADWKDEAQPGKGEIDPELKRSVNWPAQLICYFAGKQQILALKADYKKKLGAQYSERRFHDELLAMGSIPYVFARTKMLGEPVPGF
ncbi:DUF885 domain-containing protein [Ideonella azotifigens]|uniref:DUF885 domain-containing protein n=1 Tax=Ideonella azotifigens TaxID=513160 RepID=A0ABN1K348_9BURK|nr:DUF885 family protein [Ideonella azotifigens]MCD2344634.1 DUF885 domain-containing protein [Ideonella azotifigens]